jgi:hypothetical protein
MKRVLFFVACLLAASSCAFGPTMGSLDLNGYGPTIDFLYTSIGKNELVLCLNVTKTAPRAYRLERIELPRQSGNDSTSVASHEGCGGVGDLHNHPQNLGGLYAGFDVSQPSDVDFNSFKENKTQRVMVVWSGPDKYSVYIKPR